MRGCSTPYVNVRVVISLRPDTRSDALDGNMLGSMVGEFVLQYVHVTNHINIRRLKVSVTYMMIGKPMSHRNARVYVSESPPRLQLTGYAKTKVCGYALHILAAKYKAPCAVR